MNNEVLTSKVANEFIGQRLDQVLPQVFSGFSRSKIQSWIKTGKVKVDGEVIENQRHILLGGEQIELIAEQEIVNSSLLPEEIALDIVYEDDDILVINKQPDLVVHPGAGNQTGTLANGLLFYCPQLAQLPRTGIVHRLDKDTSGLLVVAKTLQAHANLVEQFQNRSVERVYDALVAGKVISGGTINQPIGRHPKDRKRMAVRIGGKEAISKYRVEEKFRAHSLLKVQLETGRTHQIRVHLSHLGFPLFGDAVYGQRLRIPKQMMPEFIEILRGFKRQALHAGRLGLFHPVTGKKMTWKADLPDDMALLVDILRDDEVDFIANQDNDYDEIDYDYGVEVEWVTDDDIDEDF